MGLFPEDARIIPNPYNKIGGFTLGHVHFVPGFPVMAWRRTARSWALNWCAGRFRIGAPNAPKSRIGRRVSYSLPGVEPGVAGAAAASRRHAFCYIPVRVFWACDRAF